MKIENWPLDKIKPYERNAKLHQVNWIAASIRDFKPDQPIVVDGDGVIIKGHGRLEAAQQLCMKTFPVIVRTDLTPEQVRLARIADNRSAEAGWNFDILVPEVDDLHTLLPDYNFGEIGMNAGWLDGLNTENKTPISFEGEDRAGASPWEKFSKNGKDTTTVLFTFGGVTCNVPKEVYDRFLTYVGSAEVLPKILALLEGMEVQQ